MDTFQLDYQQRFRKRWTKQSPTRCSAFVLSATLPNVQNLMEPERPLGPDSELCEMSERPRAAEFLAEMCLVGLALENAGCEVVYANGIEPMKRRSYLDNLRSEHFDLGDVSDVLGDRVRAIEIATESPCADPSLAGARRGLEWSQSGMFWEFMRVLDEMGARRPGSVMIENVAGRERPLEADDLAVAMKPLDGYQLEREGSHAVALELEIDEEVELEGLAREIVHAIQAERKDAGFSIDQRIRLAIGGDELILRAVEAHRDWTTGEVLAKDLELPESRQEWSPSTTIEGRTVSLEVTPTDQARK